jgi:predicted secreted protein
MPTYRKGRTVLFKYGSQTSPESYTAMGGLRNCEMTISASPVDVTNKDSGGFQTMLPGAGVTKYDVTAQGLFDDGPQLDSLILAANPPQSQFSGQLIFDNGDTYTGNWVVVTLKRTGNYDGAETYDFSFASSGTIVFNAGG